MIEGEDGLRTLECLRGRLLAERVASRVAKEDAELLGNKLIELERQLKEETKLRNRAEKKFKFLRKKMENLKLSPVSSQSNSTDSIESSNSSFKNSSDQKEPEEQEQDSQTTNSAKCRTEEDIFPGDQSHYNLEANAVVLDHQMPLVGMGSSSLITAHSCSNSGVLFQEPGNLNESSKELITDDPRQVSNGEEFNGENDSLEDVDNTLAIVPVKMSPVLQTCEPKIDNGNVRDVLAALRRAREQLQSSMARKNVIYSVKLCGKV